MRTGPVHLGGGGGGHTHLVRFARILNPLPNPRQRGGGGGGGVVHFSPHPEICSMF